MKHLLLVGWFGALLVGCAVGQSGIGGVNRRFDHGMTLLMQAALDGNSGAVDALIDRGADVNARNDDGYTALMLAVVQDHAAVVRTLIDNGADVNASAGFGMNPLVLASLKGNQEIIRLLKDAGASTGFEGSSDPPRHPDGLPQELLRQ